MRGGKEGEAGGLLCWPSSVLQLKSASLKGGGCGNRLPQQQQPIWVPSSPSVFRQIRKVKGPPAPCTNTRTVKQTHTICHLGRQAERNTLPMWEGDGGHLHLLSSGLRQASHTTQPHGLLARPSSAAQLSRCHQMVASSYDITPSTCFAQLHWSPFPPSSPTQSEPQNSYRLKAFHIQMQHSNNKM